MGFTESAIFLDLHPVGMCLLILCCVVVPVLALCAGKCDPCTHGIPPENMAKCTSYGFLNKKRAARSFEYYSTSSALRQEKEFNCLL